MEQSSGPAGSDETDENRISEEEIDQTLEDSFPASDPPQWTLGIEPQEESGLDEKNEVSE